MRLREFIQVKEVDTSATNTEKLLAELQTLQRRSATLLVKIITVLDSQDQLEAKQVQIQVDPRGTTGFFSGSPARSYMSKKLIVLGSTFIDAPDEVLIWVIGHELAHILRQHSNVDAINKPKPNIQRRQQELDADGLAIQIFKRLNIRKAAVFTWIERERGGIEQQLRFERSTAGELWQQNSTHPGHIQRINNAKKHDIELSKADLLKNLAELDKVAQTLA